MCASKDVRIYPQRKQNDQKLDVVREYTEAVWSNLPSSAMAAEATYLSGDFQNLDNDGNVLMDKKAYIGMAHLLFTAFKDFKWRQSDLRQEGDSVIMSGHFEGTHTESLDLSALGMDIISPTCGYREALDRRSQQMIVTTG